jgi:ATP-dependent protease ClpP protease subunit
MNPLERVLEDAARGRFLSAREAIDYGLADQVATPDARIYRLPGRRIGFGPQ